MGKSLRCRVTSMPIQGKVIEWKGTYGWVEPDEPLKHPTFNGKLFLHKDDLLVREEPTVGSVLVFLVYSDPSGLGVERALNGSLPGARDRVANVSPAMPRPQPHVPAGVGTAATDSPRPSAAASAESTRSAPAASSAAESASTPVVSHPTTEIAQFSVAS